MTAHTKATLFKVYSIDFFEPYSLLHHTHPIQNQSHPFGLMSMIAQIRIIQLIVHKVRNNIVIVMILSKNYNLYNDWVLIFNLILKSIV